MDLSIISTLAQAQIEGAGADAGKAIALGIGGGLGAAGAGVGIGYIFGLQIPSLALYAATANISVPLVLTLFVWFGYHIEGIRAKGFVGYLKSWIPAGVEGPARIPIFVIEVISHFVRLVSLSVRLFANILAGHLLILFMGGGLVVLLNVAVGLAVVIGIVTGAMAVAFFLFEVGLVATLQAFIFATLTAIYLGGAVAEEH
jgi:F-type H+-transporting ATPase subunit a